jgi:hypothetical protein
MKGSIAVLARGRSLLLFAATIACSATAAAQNPQPSPDLALAAAQAASVLQAHKIRHVAVLDFASANSDQWDATGREIASEFRAELASHAPSFTILDHAMVIEMMQREHFDQGDPLYPVVASYALHNYKVVGWIAATILVQPKSLVLNFTVRRVKNGEEIATFQATRTLLVPDKADLSNAPRSRPRSGPGSTAAACIECPQAHDTDEALKHRLQAYV